MKFQAGPSQQLPSCCIVKAKCSWPRNSRGEIQNRVKVIIFRIRERPGGVAAQEHTCKPTLVGGAAWLSVA